MARTPVNTPEELKDVDFNLKPGKKLLMSNDEVVELRRLEVIRRRLKGQTVLIIAKALSCSENTIYNDIKAIREANSKYVSEFRQEDFIGDTLDTYRRIESEAWDQVFFLDRGDSRKAKFLDMVKNSRKEQIKLLQSSGLLHKEAEKVEVQLTTEVINDWSDDQKQLVADAILEASIVDVDEQADEEVLSLPPVTPTSSFEEIAEFIEEQ